MRLIDADALITDCQLAQKQADRHGREYADAFYSGGGEISTEWWCVEDMIENAPTIEPERKKGRWIPCTERMPDIDADGYTDKVLVSFDHYSGVEICEYRITDGVGRWYAGDTDDSPEDIDLQVTAWMPLPKRYEGGDT